MKPVRSYVENGITINVYPEKKVKKVRWMKNDTFYAALARIEPENPLFSSFTRKVGHA
jgi:hypothetical protein